MSTQASVHSFSIGCENYVFCSLSIHERNWHVSLLFKCLLRKHQFEFSVFVFSPDLEVVRSKSRIMPGGINIAHIGYSLSDMRKETFIEMSTARQGNILLYTLWCMETFPCILRRMSIYRFNLRIKLSFNGLVVRNLGYTIIEINCIVSLIWCLEFVDTHSKFTHRRLRLYISPIYV